MTTAMIQRRLGVPPSAQSCYTPCMDLSLAHIALLFTTALWAGALNAIAGGGTFFTFPILLMLGMNPIVANTTNKCALWFASLSGVAGFWKEIKEIKHLLPFFVGLGVLGSLLGSLLLLATPADRFDALVPWLMLTATCLFAFGKRVVRFVQRSATEATTPARPGIGIGQCIIGLYGGFFAAGMGILMMALYELAGIRTIHQMNALKNAVGLGINGISALTFLFAAAIYWPVAIILILGALGGGYLGAVLSKRVPDAWLRAFIVLYGTAMTIYFFLK